MTFYLLGGVRGDVDEEPRHRSLAWMANSESDAHLALWHLLGVLGTKPWSS